jgi:O-antigen/teichoic acid export membrane protein
MLDRIFKLGKETAIYGLSSIVGRFLNFLLVPVTTNFLTTADYGIMANIYAYIAFVFVIYGYGMDSAYMRFVASLETADKKQTVSVPYFSLLGTSILFSVLIYLCAPAISGVLGLGAIPAGSSASTRSPSSPLPISAWRTVRKCSPVSVCSTSSSMCC